MTWNDGLTIGVDAIDNQHKQLCKAIDDLYIACESGKGRAEIISTLDFLRDYTIKHFADEQVLQKKCGYPKCDQHKALHEAFLAQVVTLRQQVIDSGAGLVEVNKVVRLVTDWLYNHIKKVDVEIAQYVK